ncbi:MAG: discoidin domain-containing protein [Spirochaetes bacterium]|nr:discoidin domain-containing protein [Spirochaetota bacterium]
MVKIFFKYIAVFLLLISRISAFPESGQQEKILLVVPDTGFDEMQYVVARAKLEDAGFIAESVNLNGGFSVGNKELKIMPDLKLSEAVPEDYAAVLLTDCNNTDELQKNVYLNRICRSFAGSGKIIGAAGNAPLVLAGFSLLKNKKAACWPSVSEELKLSGADYTGSVICASGNIITGMGGSDDNIIQFVNEFAELVRNKKSAGPEYKSNDEIKFRYYDREKRFIMTQNKKVRTGSVYVPEAYDENKLHSLVFVLHGTGGKGNDMYEKGFNRYAEDLDFIVVYPDGYNGDWDILPGRKTESDDAGFFRSLIGIFSTDYSIDMKRIYFTGHSLGAFMTYSLASDMNDLITAIAPVSGLVYTPQNDDSAPTNISILHQHAVDDFNVQFVNDTPFPEPYGVMDSLKYWRRRNRMDVKEKKISIRSGVEAVIWNGRDGKTDVELIKYDTGGHMWPSTATGEICSFFYNHPPRENKIDIPAAQIKGYYDRGKQINIPVSVQKNGLVKKIRYFANGKFAGEDVKAPFVMELINYPEGVYRITAEAELKNGARIFSGSSVQFAITAPDAARNCSVKSSSDESTYNTAENVTDGDQYTRWSSRYSDDQWIEIDLGRIKKISGAVLVWETAFAAAYEIQVSSDEQKWKTVYSTDKCPGGTEKINFEPVSGRYVRMSGIRRATQWGYSLWDFLVTAK